MPLAISFIGSAGDVANATTYTFSSQSIGTAADDRIVVVTTNSEGSDALSSGTIAGVSATVHATAPTGANGLGAGVMSAVVPTGTTGDVVVTWTEGAVRCEIGIWTITGANTTVNDTDTDVQASATVSTLNVDIPVNGCAIGAHTYSATGGIAYTGSTERYNESVEQTSWDAGGADVTPTGSERLAHAITATGPSGDIGGAAVSWAEAVGASQMLLLGVG